MSASELWDRAPLGLDLLPVVLLVITLLGCNPVQDEKPGHALAYSDPSPTPGKQPLPSPVIPQGDLPVPTLTAGPVTYYVSKNGLNIDGKSWATAWNELDQINWEVVQPGDQILLDGGATEMVYVTKLTIGKSGTSDSPITLVLSSEPGRDGRVVIFGGRSTPLPYCGQTGYAYETKGVRDTGIDVRDQSWVVIDGGKWSGITIYGHNRNGIRLSETSSHVTVRNVEVYDNGSAIENADGSWHPELPGVDLSGTFITFERAIVHDNGQDAFQSAGGVGDFTLRQSWLYQGRKHPDQEMPFNQCRHPDGIQVYGGGSQSGFLIEESIIGPGFMQGVLLGQQLIPPDVEATVNDVTLRHVLFTKANNSNIVAYPNTDPQNWTLDHVTSFCPEGCDGSLYVEGSGHIILNSIFYAGRIDLPDGLAESSANCRWFTTGFELGQAVELEFVDVNAEDLFSLDDYSLVPGSPCAGRGTRITSVAQLLALPDERTILPGLAWEAEQGDILPSFTVQDGYVTQAEETLDPDAGGRASYRFIAQTPGQYVVTATLNAPEVSANSLFVNIDAEPSSPTMIWDVDITDGFEERTTSWRGAGTVDLPESDPKLFFLAPGEHELIIRGREPDVLLDRVGVRLVENRIFLPSLQADNKEPPRHKEEKTFVSFVPRLPL